jgi:hypothetical protein
MSEISLRLDKAPRVLDAQTVKYRNFRDELLNLLDGKTPEDQKRAVAANQAFIRGLARPQFSHEGVSTERAVSMTAVHVDKVIANMSVMYKNSEYIGEQLMPVVTVKDRSGIYFKYPKRERFAFPDDDIAQRGMANELHETRETDNYSVKDRGYKNFVDLETLRVQDAPLNEMVDLFDAILDGIALKREKRILDIVATAGNFGGNTADAGTEWNDATDPGGSIVSDILNARAALWRGAAATKLIGFTTIGVWNSGIANNPKIRELFKYTGSGLAVTQQVAGFFRLDDIIITESREDTANEGQTASYARVMTADSFGILSVATRPTTRSLHFGSTFRTNDSPVSTQWTDPAIGKAGGIYGRVALSEDYKIVAPDAGFLITDCLD